MGSNEGKRAENCRRGIATVSASRGCLLESESPLYETEPLEFAEQDWFVNGVVQLRTCLEPEALLWRLHAIERAMGRRRDGPRFGPRSLDLDLLFFDDLILDRPELQLPHPRLHQRRFVVQPLCDIAPELIHPVLGKTIRSLLCNLSDGAQKVIPVV